MSVEAPSFTPELSAQLQEAQAVGEPSQPDVNEAGVDVAKKTAALVLGMEAVGLVVDGGLKVASTYMPLLEGLATRELVAGVGDWAVISKVEAGHEGQSESEKLPLKRRVAERLGSTALMVSTAYLSARTGLGAAEAAGVHGGAQLFGVQVASKAAGLSGMNFLRSRRNRE